MELKNSLIRFDFDIEDKLLILGVIILDKPHPSEELTNFIYKEELGFSDLIENLEDKYGVLDISYGEEELIGYMSYEISEENTSIILKGISDFFEKNNIKVLETLIHKEEINCEDEEEIDHEKENAFEKIEEIYNSILEKNKR
tara:strand:- start:6488 stop:6916 length:429 start_codon:yes stop_codon:yes gene_type:complete